MQVNTGNLLVMKCKVKARTQWVCRHLSFYQKIHAFYPGKFEDVLKETVGVGNTADSAMKNWRRKYNAASKLI